MPSGVPELDYPEGDANVYASYGGTGGVPLGSFWTRLLFALHFRDLNIVLTDYTTEGSRIQFRQSLQERVHRIAPFLRLDRDPYIVTTPAGLFWIQDAYTTSDRYPYSEPSIRGAGSPGHAVQLHPQQRQGRDQRLRRLGRASTSSTRTTRSSGPIGECSRLVPAARGPAGRR